jgi:hypothetical protein
MNPLRQRRLKYVVARTSYNGDPANWMRLCLGRICDSFGPIAEQGACVDSHHSAINDS